MGSPQNETGGGGVVMQTNMHVDITIAIQYSGMHTAVYILLYNQVQ